MSESATPSSGPSPLIDADRTLPPLRASDAFAVCPRCRKSLGFEGSLAGSVPRCPEHGLAFVSPAALVGAGDDPLLGRTLAGRFVVLERLGSGSMGSVYRARQEAVGRDVALKVVRPDRAYDAETRTRFEREARAMSALESPHTVTVFDFGEAEDGSWFLAMELLVGETVGARLKRLGPFSVDVAARVMRDALASLSEAHTLGIVHRDLKPENLFFAGFIDSTRRGEATERIKVLDFGIAKLLRDDVRVDQLETQAGTVFGTPRYMSPEQAQGAALDGRSDLYSLGVVLFTMLTGNAPFTDDDAVVVMARHIRDAAPSLADANPALQVPPALERYVARLMAKQPSDRPDDAAMALRELDAALELAQAHQSGLHPTSWTTPSPRQAARRRWRNPSRLTLFGAAALVSVVLVGGASLRRPLDPVRSALSALGKIAPPRLVGATNPVADDAVPVSVVVPATSAAPSASSATVARPRTSPSARAPSVAGRTGLSRRPGDRYGRFD